MPKISIIVPVYNVENYLKKCLDSIVNQTFKDIEIILINDGSTDNSLNICKEYAKKDHRIRLINKPNGGLSSARNVGIDLSTGEYLGFVDSDDWIALNMYEKLYNLCKIFNADISQCKYIRNNEQKLNTPLRIEIFNGINVLNQ